jgi:hypothetical protein
MGHFSMEIDAPTGSNLSGNQQSCPRNPCDADAKRLRRKPKSTTSTDLRARSSWRDAAIPA